MAFFIYKTIKNQTQGLKFLTYFYIMNKEKSEGRNDNVMAEIKLNLENSKVEQKSILEYKEEVEKIHEDLHKRANDEKDFVGWLELPTNYNKIEFARIKQAAKKIQKESDILVVIGITCFQKNKENILKYYM